MRCANCGYAIEEGKSFCGQCGSPVKTVEVIPTSQQTYPVTSSDMTVVDWIITFIVQTVPIANVVCMILWISDKRKPSRKNYCIAYLILFAISIVLTIAFWSVFAAIMQSIIDELF